MQITFINDFNNGPQPPFTAQEIASFQQDELAAETMFESTFTDNISLTFNVGFGSYQGQNLDTIPNGMGGFFGQGTAVAAPNTLSAVDITYTNLRNALFTFGQPNFFTPTNLPAGNSINNITNFYITSSVAKAFGLAVPNPGADGFVGIGTNFTPGAQRVDAFLHEIGHAMGRYDVNLRQGANVAEFDLMRFLSPAPSSNRLFLDALPSVPAYFSLDGGVTPLADWGRASDPSDFLNPPDSNRTPNDPFNEIVGTLGRLTPLDIQAMEALGFKSNVPVVNAAPPPGTTAVMVLRQTSPSITDGTYNIYDIGNNGILANFQLGKVGAPFQFVTLGGFNDGDTSDMLLRNATTGAFQVYDIVNNNITNSASLGTVGTDFAVLAFGNFSSVPGETDMLLRNNTGALQVYNISNNRITNSVSMGVVGTDWQFSGVGNFGNVPGESDLLLRNVNTGGLQVYDIAGNQLVGSAFIGTVGMDYQFSGVGNFSSVPGASDLLLRSSTTGALQIYNIRNNQLTGSTFIGNVGTDYKFAGVAPISAAGRSDLVLRSVTTGAFQAYNIAFSSLTGSASLGALGLDWQLPQFPAVQPGLPGGGFAADPPSASTASLGDSSQPAQLTQAMAGLGGSTADTSNTIDGNAVGSPVDPSSFSSSMLNPAPPDATTANMVLRNASTTTATYEIYNLGANSILAGSAALGQVGSDWGFVTLGNFNLSDPSDMLLRNSTSGAFQVYDIANNNIISSTSLGTVGSNWQVMGFGTFGAFGSFGEDDMILRDVNTGKLQVYNIDNNQITGSASIGTIGLDWQFSGIGNFGGAGTSDLLVRNSNTGDLQVYNIHNNQITGSAFIGTVGLDWQFSGVGDFSSVPDESDLLLRNSNTGGLEVLNINNNQVTGSAFLGTVGLDWQFAGVAPISVPGASDLVLRNVNTGAFQVYNIANNHLTGSASLGQVGVDWQLGGFAPTFSVPPPRSEPAGMDGSTAQLVQAMAGFGGGSGAADSLNIAPLGADASQQPLLTTPQHA
jgi:hypothetical protein